MTTLFWISLALVAYVYAGYPALLKAWARLRPRPLRPGDGNSSDPPHVSIVIAARNEGRRLPARIDNLLQLEYPAARRQIVVVSDGSTDETVASLAPYSRLVDVVAVPPGGKALALNAGVDRARHEIVVFADARQVFAPDALLELTRPFRDPSVGAVTGELLLDCEPPRNDDRRTHDRRHDADAHQRAEDRRRRERRGRVLSTISDGVGLYWQYEKALRRLESHINSTLGATGCIYAIRRTLWRPLPAATILDDVLTPMRIVLNGARVVFNERARAFDRAAANGDAESRRKVRTLAGNYQVLRLEPRLLLPWRNPVWLQYASHKIGRLLVPYALLGVLTGSMALAGTHAFYTVVLGAQVTFYLLAGYGAWLDWRERSRSGALVPIARPRAAREEAA